MSFFLNCCNLRPPPPHTHIHPHPHTSICGVTTRHPLLPRVCARAHTRACGCRSSAETHPAFKPHPVQGWTPDFIPKNMDAAVYDELLHVRRQLRHHFGPLSRALLSSTPPPHAPCAILSFVPNHFGPNFSRTFQLHPTPTRTVGYAPLRPYTGC